MLRELVERFGYRYRQWTAEKFGDKVGAGEPLPVISPKTESSWAMVLRFLWRMVWGLVLISAVGRIAAAKFPTARDAIATGAVALAIIWVGVGLFIMAGEFLGKQSDRDSDGKSI